MKETFELRIAPAFVGEGKRNWYRAHRARLFVVDVRGRRVYLPNTSMVDRPEKTDGWMPLSGRLSVDVPTPLGFAEAGFNADKVTAVGINVEAFNREGERSLATSRCAVCAWPSRRSHRRRYSPQIPR